LLGARVVTIYTFLRSARRMRVGEAAITWTRVVISCRDNCCRRPVFKKNLVLTSLLSAVVLRPRRSRHLRILFLQHRHRRLADADSPMFQQAPMLPIFDVWCVHRPNSSHFWTDLLPVFSVIVYASQATKLSTTESAPHFRFHLEIPNFKYRICPKSKYKLNLHFLHNRLEFRNKIFTQNLYILIAAASKARTKSTVWKLNRKP